MITTNDTFVKGRSLRELALPDRMHRLAYADPEVFDLEMERIYGNTWIFVGHESQVANPGDFLTTTIGVQPVILTRDQSGQVQVLFNRCVHRGALVCREERGNASYFRCLYHGWAYGNDGRLMTVPYAGGYGPDFDMSELGLGHVPNVATYRGFVFACLAPDVEPLAQYLGRAADYLDLLVDLSPTGEIAFTRGIAKYSYNGNWKLHLENWADSYHPAFTHEAAFKINDVRRGRVGGTGDRGDLGSENVDLGHGHSMLDYSRAQYGARPVSFKVDATHRAALEARLGPERAERAISHGNMNLNVFPNLLFRSADPELLVIRPVRVDYTEMYVYGYRLTGASEAENNRGARSVATAASIVQSDDLEAFERIQQGLRVTSMEWMLYNRGTHREWVDEHGELRGMGADETGQRGQHREWRRLMLQEPRPCCRDRGCLGPRAEIAGMAP